MYFVLKKNASLITLLADIVVRCPVTASGSGAEVVASRRAGVRRPAGGGARSMLGGAPKMCS
eukprot:7376078-Prymnesium_polylepis.1